MQYTPPLTGQDLRGSNYLKVRAECESTLRNLFEQKRAANNGKFTLLAIAEISRQIGLPPKTVCNFLEQFHLLLSGTWERCGLSSSELLKRAKELI